MPMCHVLSQPVSLVSLSVRWASQALFCLMLSQQSQRASVWFASLLVSCCLSLCHFFNFCLILLFFAQFCDFAFSFIRFINFYSGFQRTLSNLLTRVQCIQYKSESLQAIRYESTCLLKCVYSQSIFIAERPFFYCYGCDNIFIIMLITRRQHGLRFSSGGGKKNDTFLFQIDFPRTKPHEKPGTCRKKCRVVINFAPFSSDYSILSPSN